jgi:hypothetical protein
MDNSSVLRWLDDIGLPQHKEAFHNAKVDGRVLHRLTTEDLLLLNVTAQLHAASLRRGIQVIIYIIILFLLFIFPFFLKIRSYTLPKITCIFLLL